MAAVVDCEMIVTVHTSRDPARSFVDRIQAMEGKDGVLSISIAHGFAWGDVPEMGTKVLVYADGDEAKARALARQLADELIGMREALGVPHPSIDDALDQALAFAGGPVVISDGADNPGGGAASDATFFLRRIVERGIGDVAIGPFWDPVAARIAIEAGEGARLALRIGGKVSPLSGDPIDLDCTVKAVRREHQQTGLSNTRTFMGDSVLVESERRRDPALLAAQPGDGHRPLHRHRLRPGGEEDRGREVVAALPRLVFEDRRARDLRRRARCGDARPAHAALPQGAPAEVAARRLIA